MNIIVTGASRGIGYQLVKQLRENKDVKVLAIARNETSLQRLQQECGAEILCWDLSSGDPQLLGQEIRKIFTDVDVLVNNAGMLVNKPFADISQDDLRNVYQVNVFSVVSTIQQVLPLMGKKGRSHVVNISSMGGFQGSMKFAGLSAYSSSKAALASLTECLAEEFKTENIAFNCLALGSAQTEMLEEAFPGYKAPLSAVQMATYIRSFALDAGNYMNGKIIPLSLTNP